MQDEVILYELDDLLTLWEFQSTN